MADATKIRVGYSGAVYVAPVGTTAPTDPFAAWGVGWVDMGYIADDGIAQGFGQDVAEFMAWGNTVAPVLTRVTKEETTFKLTFLQSTKDVIGVFYGLASTDFTDTALSVGPPARPAYSKFTKVSATTPDVRALGLDVLDGANTRRIIVPRVQITAHDDLTYKSDELTRYGVTFKALLASDGSSFLEYVTNV